MAKTTTRVMIGCRTELWAILFHSLLVDSPVNFLSGQNIFLPSVSMKNGFRVNSRTSRTATPTATPTADW